MAQEKATAKENAELNSVGFRQGTDQKKAYCSGCKKSAHGMRGWYRDVNGGTECRCRKCALTVVRTTPKTKPNKMESISK